MFPKIRILGALAFSLHLTFAMAVVELGDDTFNTDIAKYPNVLVMFYAPWCGHCKKLKPEFDKAAKLLRDNDPPIALAKVDCTESGKDTCGKFDVSGYPTLKIFSNGNLVKDYGGPREAGGIVKYMKAQVGPSSKELKSLNDFKKFTKKDSLVVVGYFPQETDLKGTFLSVASKLREKIDFAHTAIKDILEQQGVSDTIQIFRPQILSSKFEDEILTYKGPNTLSEIESWIQDNYHGLVGHRTRENAEDFKPPVVVAYYNVDYAKNPKGTNYWRNRILKVAKDYSGAYKFAISAKDDFQHEINEYGIDFTPSDKPIVAAKGPNKEKYIMKDEFSIENLQKFLSELESGKLVAHLKSEPIPDSNDGPVKVAVAKNFKDLVTDNKKDVLIEFYAPWCGHCKNLVPTYDKLGEKMKGEDIEIVKMDATANDVPSPFEVQGFPTLFWLPKHSKKPIPYEGGRDLNDFIKFIAKHATKELNQYDRYGKEKPADVKEEL